MKLIDEKGRLFGKLNIIDLLVILLILAVLGRFVMKVDFKQANDGKGVEVETQTVEYDFVVLNVRDVTVAAVQEGDAVKDSKTNVSMGTVTKVESVPHVDEFITPEGEVMLVESKIYYDMTVTLETPAIANENTILVNKKELRVGAQITLQAANFSISGNVWRIEVK